MIDHEILDHIKVSRELGIGAHDFFSESEMDFKRNEEYRATRMNKKEATKEKWKEIERNNYKNLTPEQKVEKNRKANESRKLKFNRPHPGT